VGQYSFSQLEQLWEQAGGNPLWAPVAAGIALAESGGNSTSLNNNPSTGDYSVGLWQINYYGELATSRTQQFGSPTSLQSNPLAQAKAAVALSGNGATWQPWAGDPVGNAALSSTQPMSAAQVQSILSGAGRSTGGAAAGTTQTATLTSSSTAFGISTTPPSPPSGVNALNPAADLVWVAQFGAWSIFTALVFVFGLILILLGLLMLGVVLLGPVVGPAGELIPGPVGTVVSRTSRAGKGSSVGAPGRTASAVGRPIAARGRTRRSTRAQSALEERRHEYRMTEMEHRAATSRYRRYPPGPSRVQPETEEPF